MLPWVTTALVVVTCATAVVDVTVAHTDGQPLACAAGEQQPTGSAVADGMVLTAQNGVVMNLVTALEEDAVEVSDHAARARELLNDEDTPSLTDAERAASVAWTWQSGVGLVRQG